MITTNFGETYNFNPHDLVRACQTNDKTVLLENALGELVLFNVMLRGKIAHLSNGSETCRYSLLAITGAIKLGSVVIIDGTEGVVVRMGESGIKAVFGFRKHPRKINENVFVSPYPNNSAELLRNYTYETERIDLLNYYQRAELASAVEEADGNLPCAAQSLINEIT